MNVPDRRYVWDKVISFKSEFFLALDAERHVYAHKHMASCAVFFRTGEGCDSTEVSSVSEPLLTSDACASRPEIEKQSRKASIKTWFMYLPNQPLPSVEMNFVVSAASGLSTCFSVLIHC